MHSMQLLLKQKRGRGVGSDMTGSIIVSGKVKLLTGVLLLQFCYAGFHIVSSTALNMGVSKLVFLLYRNILGFILLSPFAYFLEKRNRPSLTFSLLLQFFLLALIGITANQGFYFVGLYYLSPTFASAIQNSAPAITYAMAAAMRIEQVSVTDKYGLAKVVGTLASVTGATVITLFKGPALLNHSFGFLSSSNEIENWTLGCVYILGNCLAWSAWIVLQVPVLKKYPARLSLTAYTCLFGIVQFMAISVFIERNVEVWKIKSTGELLTLLYAGLVASGITFALQIWCIDRGGPLFVAVFQPVQTVIVAIMASLILGDKIYSGGLAGAVIIMMGLYFVLWGRSNEQRRTEQGKDGDLRRNLLEEEITRENDGTICDVP